MTARLTAMRPAGRSPSGSAPRRAPPHQGGELLRERGIDLVEHGPCLREGLGQGLAHSDSGCPGRKDESAFHDALAKSRAGLSIALTTSQASRVLMEAAATGQRRRPRRASKAADRGRLLDGGAPFHGEAAGSFPLFIEAIRCIQPACHSDSPEKEPSMARVTVEDCIDKVENRFELVLLASHRARLISSGSPLTIDRDQDKNPVVALREIADETIAPDDLKEQLIHSLQKYVEVDEPEAETVPLLGNTAAAAVVGSDNDAEIQFDRMSEEDLLRGLEGLVPPPAATTTSANSLRQGRLRGRPSAGLFFVAVPPL